MLHCDEKEEEKESSRRRRSEIKNTHLVTILCAASNVHGNVRYIYMYIHTCLCLI